MILYTLECYIQATLTAIATKINQVGLRPTGNIHHMPRDGFIPQLLLLLL